jgi:hypothetical protein
VSSGPVQDGLQGPVFGRVVGDAILPAAPDDVQPGAGEDPDGVGMVVAAVAGSGVEVGGHDEPSTPTGQSGCGGAGEAVPQGAVTSLR